jgi:hypothetical protein
MKKFLAVAVLALCAASALAKDIKISVPDISAKNFKVYGAGAVAGFSVRNNYDFTGGNKSNGFQTTTNLLGLQFNVEEDIYARIAAGYTASWGDSMNEGKPLSDYLDNIHIVEANLTFENFFGVKGLKTTAGRQFYGDDKSMVIYQGPKTNRFDFDQNTYSLDALTLYWESDKIKANVIYANFLDNYAAGVENMTLKGFDVKLRQRGLSLQLYGYDFENIVTNHNTLAGIKPAAEIEAGNAVVKVSVEAAKQFGGDKVFSHDIESLDTNFIKADVSVVAGKFEPRVMYFVEGGESKAFNTAFGTFAPGLIYSNTIYENNIQIINAGVNYKAGDKLALVFDVYDFKARKGGAKFGREANLKARYQYSKHFGFNAGYGYFLADDKFSDYNSQVFMLGMDYKF